MKIVKRNSRQRGTEVENIIIKYMEGSSLLDREVAVLLKHSLGKTSTIPVCYRLMRSNLEKKPGDKVILKGKPLVSVSDRPNNALYAGLSYNHDSQGEYKIPKFFHLVKMTNVKVLYTYEYLLDVQKREGYDVKRTEREREYICTLPAHKKVVVVESMPYERCLKKPFGIKGLP